MRSQEPKSENRRTSNTGWRWANVVRRASRFIIRSWSCALAVGLLLPIEVAAQGVDDVPPLEPARPELPPTFWEQHTAAVILYSVQFGALLAFIVWIARKPRRRVVVSIEIKTRRKLEALRGHSLDGATLSIMSRCVRDYFVGAYQLPPGEYTTTDFGRLLATWSEIDSELAKQTGAWLQMMDQARFAAHPPGAPPDSLSQALELIERSEQHRQVTPNRESAPRS